jgi:hypothetical protein
MADEVIKLFATPAERYPEPDNTDKLRGTARGALAAIPILGGPIAETLSMVLARRRDDWLKELSDDLDKVNANVEGFSIENLVKDEVFISAAIQATHIAIRFHRREEHEVLRNALLNLALGKGPQEDVQHVVLDAIEAFSAAHIKILQFFWKGWSELNRLGHSSPMRPYAVSNFGAAIGLIYPELKGQEGLMQCTMNDIRNRGFSTVARPGTAIRNILPSRI